MKRRTLATEAERNSAREGTICMDAFDKAWTKTRTGWASVDGEFSSLSLELLVLHEAQDWDALRPARDDIAGHINEVDKTLGWETAPEAAGFYATAILDAGYRKSEAAAPHMLSHEREQARLAHLDAMVNRETKQTELATEYRRGYRDGLVDRKQVAAEPREWEPGDPIE